MSGKPASRGSLPAKLLASAALIVVSGSYAFWQAGAERENKPAFRPALRSKPPVPSMLRLAKASSAPEQKTAVPDAAPHVAKTPPQPRPAASPSGPPVQTAEASRKLILPTYSDGDYTGAPVDSDFGPVQVEVIVQGGRITDVRFLQIPDHRQRSAEISEEAIPILVQEAIQVQGPAVDIVSSATYTTATFADALYNALSKAQK